MDMDVRKRKLNAYFDKLLTSTHWAVIDTENTPIKLDTLSTALLTRVNLMAMLKAGASADAEPKRLNTFDFLLQPVIGYIDRAGALRVIAGLFSYQQFLHNCLTKIPVLLFAEAPPTAERHLMLLSELTRTLLDQQAKSGVENLNELLCAIFRTTGTQGIFSSTEWQLLYPGIKNKSQFCKWLGISSKTFRDRREVMNENF